MAIPAIGKRIYWRAHEETDGQLTMVSAVVPAAPLPGFEDAGGATAVFSRAVDEERRADCFPPAIKRVSPEIRGICTIS